MPSSSSRSSAMQDDGMNQSFTQFIPSNLTSSFVKNELIQFIDFILPFTQIPLDIVHEIIEHYHFEKKRLSLLHGDQLQVWEVHREHISAYYPAEYHEILTPLINRLIEKYSLTEDVYVIKLLDLLILLTILCRGKLRDKAQLFFSYYAIHEPEGMLEWEHSLFIQRVSLCLKKIGAIKGSELSVEDANYLAFLARVKEGRRGFHLSLTFNDFFHWIQNSPETSPAFAFMRLINRFLRVCQTLHTRMDSLTSLLNDITSDNYSTQTLHVPKLSLGYKYVQSCPYLLLLTDNSAHFLIHISNNYEHDSEISYYVQIDSINPFSESSFPISKHERSTECCERYYVKSVNQQLVPVRSCHSTIRLDIDRSLLPETHYHFTFYTSSNVRYPVISAKTKSSQAKTPSQKSMISLHPSTLSLVSIGSYVSTLDCTDLITIFTGWIFPFPEKIIGQISSVLQLSNMEFHENLKRMRDIIVSYFSYYWIDSETAYCNVFPQGSIAMDGLVNHVSGDRQLLVYCCRSLGLWSQQFKAVSPIEYHQTIEQIFSDLYYKHVAPFLSPLNVLERGDTKLYLIRAVHDQTVAFGLTVREITQEIQLLYGLPTSSTTHHCRHLIFVIQSPRDLMKHFSKWQEDDSLSSPAGRLPQDEQQKPKEKPKLRGKHELIHGAYSSTPTVTFSAPLHENHRHEIRKGGDREFNALIRMLHKWMSFSPPGHRKVSLVSVGWLGGIDFGLSLDGQHDHIITHRSLERTVSHFSQLESEDRELLKRIELSFNEKVHLETSSECHGSTSMTITSHGADSPSVLEFIPILQDSSSQSVAVIPNHECGVHILESKITMLSHNFVSIEVILQGRGPLYCSLYEVPLMATTADVMRLVETELDQMTLISDTCNQIISENSLSFQFSDLVSYCSYAIVLHHSLSDKAVSCQPEQLLHFRTYFHPERYASTTILASIAEEECMSPSEMFYRLKCELDGYTRPTAAPLQLIQTDVRYLPNFIFHYHYSLTPKSKLFSSDFRSISRKTYVSTSGFFDKFWETSYPPVPPNLPLPSPCPSVYSDIGRISEYETSCGGVDVIALNEEFRYSLHLNTRKSLKSLLHHLSLVVTLNSVRNIQIFSPKPLIPHCENRYPSHSPCHVDAALEDSEYLLWEKSKHYFDPEYNDLLTQIVETILKWKSGSSNNRDCQIFATAPISDVVLSYIHGCNETHFQGIRHITLPVSVGLLPSEERMAFSSKSALSHLVVTSYLFEGGKPPSNLHSYTPFHFVPPRFALHGTTDVASRYLSRPIYRITVFTKNLLEHPDDVVERAKYVGFHHDVVIKQVIHDIDSLELTLGPVVGNVTYSTCGILFEINRKIDRLQCVLKPVEYPDQTVEMILECKASHCLKFEFTGLTSGLVYEIFLPEIHGKKILGKFRTLSTKSMYSEVLFLGEETLEYFPVTHRIISDLNCQQALSFSLIGLESDLRTKFSLIASELSLQNDTLSNEHQLLLSSHEVPYRRPWNAVRSRMKGISCPTSVVIHIGSHALLCRIFKAFIPPLIEIVKKYRLDDVQFVQTSALSTFYQAQLVQVVEDTLRAIWIMEPAVKEVFQSSANIALYNTEYWLNEDVLTPSQSKESSRDYLAFNIIRNIYETGLQKYIYTLRDWNNRSYHHFFQWKEGSMTIAALDFASEQMGNINRNKLKKIQSITVNESEIAATSEIDGTVEEVDESGDEDDEGDNFDEIKASTFTADFMSENQWKHLRQILMDKTVNQLVICSQNPLIPLEMLLTDEEGDTVVKSAGPSNWKPSEDNITKLFEQFFKWLVPKKSLEHYKNLTIICTSEYSYVTNIQDVKSGMKIQQVCLGKFSCINEAHTTLNYDQSTFQLAGKLGGMRYAHRVCGLDTVTLDSSRSGGGGRYSGSMTMWQQPGDAVYGLLRYWFDSWKAIGTCNFFPIHSTGIPDAFVGIEAVLLVGPIIGAPYLRSSNEGSKMMVPILLEVDRDVNMTMIATELFSGKQMTLTLKLMKMKPTVIRIGPLQLDSRYTLEFLEGIQNSHAYKFVIQTTLNWTDTNIVLLNATPQEDPSKNSSEFVRDIIKRFQVPFHGLTAVLHTDVEVDVTAILDEARTFPDLDQMLQDSIHASNLSIQFRLLEFVKRVMDRIREEYRMYLSRPSYRELLLRGFNLFMPREDEELTFFEDDELFIPQHGNTGSLTSLLNLIVSRVRQEYFDQFLFQEDRLYGAWPRIRRTKEMIYDETTRKKLQHDNGMIMQGTMMVMTTSNIDDEDILKYPKLRQPDRIYSDPSRDAIDSVLDQWMNDLISAPPLWYTWISPNRKVSIEKLCSDSDNNIREFYDKIFNDKIPCSSRILVLPSIGNLFNPENRVGYKLQEWIKVWIGNDPNRSISLFCPARNNEGTYLYSVDYPHPPGQLWVQFLNSIYSSNEKEIQKVKTEKLAEMKKNLTSKGSASGRRAKAKRKEEEEKLKQEIDLEVNEILNQLTPDGYILYESKFYQEQQDHGDISSVATSALRCISSRDDVDPVTGQSSIPTYYDYISLPSWFVKFCPCTPGVFVQDEVILLLRQDPHYREFLSLLEEDTSLFQDYRKSYESSRLSELSRPPDLREVDMTVPGIIEMFLENTIERIWSDVLPPLLKGKLFTLTDDFIRSYCLSRAFSDTQSSLSSSLSFAKAIRMMVFSCALLFLACRMATGPEGKRWEYILNSDEFFEDDDKEIKKGSDDEDSDEEEEKEEEEEKITPAEKEGGDDAENPGPGETVESKVEEKTPSPPTRDEIILQMQQKLWEITQKRIQRRRRYGEAMSYMSSSQYI